MFRRINFQSLPVRDQQRALDFYRDTLGFGVHTDAPYDAENRWIFMQIPGADTLLHLHRQDNPVANTGPALCLISDDVDAEATRLETKGLAMTQEPTTAPWNPDVRFAMFNDSEDNLVMMQSSVHEA